MLRDELGIMICLDAASSFTLFFFFGSFSQSPFTLSRIKDVTEGGVAACAMVLAA